MDELDEASYPKQEPGSHTSQYSSRTTINTEKSGKSRNNSERKVSVPSLASGKCSRAGSKSSKVGSKFSQASGKCSKESGKSSKESGKCFKENGKCSKENGKCSQVSNKCFQEIGKGYQVKEKGSQVKEKGSQVKEKDSQVKERGSKVNEKGSQASGKCSQTSNKCAQESDKCSPENDKCSQASAKCSQANDNCSPCYKKHSSDSEKDASCDDGDTGHSDTKGCKITRNFDKEKHCSINSASDSPKNDPLTCFTPVPSEIKSTTSLSSIQSFPEYKTDPDLGISDIRASLSSHLKKRYKELIRACRNFDSKGTGKLSKSHLRQVLRTFCLPLTAAQFEQLTQQLPQDEKGKLNYQNFFNSLGNFEEVDIEECTADESLTVDQIVIHLQNKFYPHLQDIVCSFWLFDYNKDGFIKKNDFKKIIKNHCMKVTDRQFAELWKRYETKDNGLLNYVEFLTKLGIHAERIKNHLPKYAPRDDPLWEEPCGKQLFKEINYSDSRRRAIFRKGDDPSVSGLTLDDVEKYFLSKLSKCGELLKRTLPMFDRQEDGQINVDDLHHVLNCFVMPMSLGMFKELFGRLNVDVTPISRSVDISNFLKRFCRPDPEARKKEFQERLKSSGCEAIIEDIRNRVMNPMEKMKTELEKRGKDNNSHITRRDLKTVIGNGLDYPLTEKNFKTLITFLDPDETNLISCGKVLGILSFAGDHDISDYLKYCTSDYLGLAPASLGEKYKDLSGEKLLSKMRYHINKNRKTFDNVVLACDPNNCKLITPAQLRTVLNNFCFPLTKKQFEELENIFEYQGDRIEYDTFLNLFKKPPGEDSLKWCRIVDKLSSFKSSASKEFPLVEVEELLSDSIKAKHKKMLQDFRTLDPCKLGFSYKEDVRAVLNRYVMRMTDAQFEHLWRNFPLNQHHCLLYEKLIKSYLDPRIANASGPISDNTVKAASKPYDEPVCFAPKVSTAKEATETTKAPAPVTPVSRPSVPASHKGSPPVVLKKDRCKKPSGDEEFQEEVFSKFPHLRKTCDSLRTKMMKHIRLIRQHIKRVDKKRKGIIHIEDLITILAHFGIKMTDEDKYFILEYFDKDLSGIICYRDLMRLFVWYA